MKDKISLVLTLAIFALVSTGVYINYAKQNAIDQSKIPEKVENNRGFQKWITNLKNSGIDVGADDFVLLEENEIYNTKIMTVYSIDAPEVGEQFEQAIAAAQGLDQVVFSPSERQFIDYRHEQRGPNLEFQPNDAHYYGLRDDKVVDSKILTCSERANCYFDRAYFLDNDVFVISEFSRNIKEDDDSPPCALAEVCTYTVKIHVFDLNKNKRFVYESQPIDLVLSEVIPEF